MRERERERGRDRDRDRDRDRETERDRERQRERRGWAGRWRGGGGGKEKKKEKERRGVTVEPGSLPRKRPTSMGLTDCFLLVDFGYRLGCVQRTMGFDGSFVTQQ